MKRTRTRENDEQGCPVEFMYRQTGRENYPPVDEIVLVVGVMADHRRFQTSPFHVFEPRASLFHPSHLSRKTQTGGEGGEAPINFQLYTHHDRNSTLLFPLVTRRCTWRTISFLHHREREGGRIHPAREEAALLPYLASLTFILCRATLPSFYLSWRRDRCISRHTILRIWSRRMNRSGWMPLLRDEEAHNEVKKIVEREREREGSMRTLGFFLSSVDKFDNSIRKRDKEKFKPLANSIRRGKIATSYRYFKWHEV